MCLFSLTPRDVARRLPIPIRQVLICRVTRAELTAIDHEHTRVSSAARREAHRNQRLADARRMLWVNRQIQVNASTQRDRHLKVHLAMARPNL